MFQSGNKRLQMVDSCCSVVPGDSFPGKGVELTVAQRRKLPEAMLKRMAAFFGLVVIVVTLCYALFDFVLLVRSLASQSFGTGEHISLNPCAAPLVRIRRVDTVDTLETPFRMSMSSSATFQCSR